MTGLSRSRRASRIDAGDFFACDDAPRVKPNEFDALPLERRPRLKTLPHSPCSTIAAIHLGACPTGIPDRRTLEAPIGRQRLANLHCSWDAVWRHLCLPGAALPTSFARTIRLMARVGFTDAETAR
jgi:hypothetical protein